MKCRMHFEFHSSHDNHGSLHGCRLYSTNEGVCICLEDPTRSASKNTQLPNTPSQKTTVTLAAKKKSLPVSSTSNANKPVKPRTTHPESRGFYVSTQCHVQPTFKTKVQEDPCRFDGVRLIKPPPDLFKNGGCYATNC